jgi:hypothetical protein
MPGPFTLGRELWYTLRCWVVPRAGLGILKERKISSPTGIWTLDRPIGSLVTTLYPGSSLSLTVTKKVLWLQCNVKMEDNMILKPAWCEKREQDRHYMYNGCATVPSMCIAELHFTFLSNFLYGKSGTIIVSAEHIYCIGLLISLSHSGCIASQCN